MYYNRYYRYGPHHRGCGSWGYGNRKEHQFRSVPVNIEEKDDRYELTLYAPLLEKEQIKIITKGDVLIISYEPEKSSEQKDKNFTRREYTVQGFERSFILNNKVLIDRIEATYSEGILKVILNKNPDLNRPGQEIPVR